MSFERVARAMKERDKFVTEVQEAIDLMHEEQTKACKCIPGRYDCALHRLLAAIDDARGTGAKS